jgi:hypothetical protein
MSFCFTHFKTRRKEKIEKKKMDEVILSAVPGMLLGALAGGIWTGFRGYLSRQPNYRAMFQICGRSVEAFQDNDHVAQAFLELLRRREINPAALDRAVIAADDLMLLDCGLREKTAEPYHEKWAHRYFAAADSALKEFQNSALAKSSDNKEFRKHIRTCVQSINERLQRYMQSVTNKVIQDSSKGPAGKKHQQTQATLSQHDPTSQRLDWPADDWLSKPPSLSQNSSEVFPGHVDLPLPSLSDEVHLHVPSPFPSSSLTLPPLL